MAKKIQVWGWKGQRKFEVADAVYALAAASGFHFGTRDETLVAYQSKPFVVPVVDVNEQAVTVSDMADSSRVHEAFTLEEAFIAVVKALGYEFRAEYVVGRSEPQIVAVPVKTKKAKAK